MTRKVLLMMALVAALTLVTGCGGGESVTAPPDVLPTTAAQIKSFLDERLPKARRGFMSADYSMDTGRVLAKYDTVDESFWDEDALIRQMATGAVDVFAVAFIPPSVKVVEVVAMVEMTDKYGNSKSEEGVTIALPRGEWEQVKDPAAFKDRIILDPTILYGIADSYQIHPGIYKNADDFSKTMPSTQ